MHFATIVLFLLMSASGALAAASLSLEDAEKLFLGNSLAVKAKRIELQKTDADILAAKTLSNPSLNYELSALKSGERENEETYSISQSIDIAGKRGKRIDAALRNKEARLLLSEQEIAELLLQMKQSYYRVLLLRENGKVLGEISAMFSEVVRTTEERVKAGDAPEADLMKLSSEGSKIMRGLEALRTDLKVERKKLGVLLNVEENEFDPAGELRYVPVSLNVKDLTDLALREKPGIRAQSATVEAAKASLSSVERDALPSVDLEAGYKRRTGGFTGVVVGVSVPVPIFDRNQGGIARTSAELERAKVELDAVNKVTKYEVTALLERIASFQRRITDLLQHLETSGMLTKIAAIAYEEGETSLLSLLDAVRSEKDLIIEYNGTVYEYWTTLFELEKTVGVKVIQMGGTK